MLPEACKNIPLMDETVVSFATVDAHGQPSVRQLLVKDYDEHGFYFYTNYQSRKAHELQLNPRGALCFYWPWIGEQVRIEGAVYKVSDAQSDQYFATRPRGSQLGAWASEQSAPLPSSDVLERRLDEFDAQFGGQPVPRPPHWGGYRLAPTMFEFWRQGEFRLHERYLYVHQNGWSMQRLQP
jgi:pyridoxamine 5'-phosphate oxidase